MSRPFNVTVTYDEAVEAFRAALLSLGFDPPLPASSAILNFGGMGASVSPLPQGRAEPVAQDRRVPRYEDDPSTPPPRQAHRVTRFVKPTPAEVIAETVLYDHQSGHANPGWLIGPGSTGADRIIGTLAANGYKIVPRD